MQQTFKKEERLCSKKLIDLLFNSSNSFSCFPFKILWSEIPLNTTYPVQVLITISKKKVNKAVQRNRIKRQAKEVYRKNKHTLYNHLTGLNKQIALVMIYHGKTEPTFQEIESKILKALNLLIDEINKKDTN